MDRFFFLVNIDYPSAEEELEIVRRTTGGKTPAASKVLGAEEVLEIQSLIREVPVADHLEERVVGLIRATRPKENGAPSIVREYVNWGAGPRACQSLVSAAKARAILAGRNAPSSEDMEICAYPVLRHRLILNFHAHGRNVAVDQVIEESIRSLRH